MPRIHRVLSVWTPTIEQGELDSAELPPPQLCCSRFATTKYAGDRGADGFVGAVDAADPATRAALTASEFVEGDSDAANPCLGFGRRNHPAYEFVSGERRDIVPCSRHLGIRTKCFLKIFWQIMHSSARKFLCTHATMVAHEPFHGKSRQIRLY